ncbi:MAG: hypothetical protein V3U86_11905, partial [Acidobacteriota bacterium]
MWTGSPPIDWAALFPTMVLVVGALALLLASTLRRLPMRLHGVAALAFLVLAAVASAAGWSHPRSAFDGLVVVDHFGIL